MLDLVAIGVRLKEIRGAITQKAIAEEFGVQRSYIANIETGRTQPSLEYLLFNATKFDVPMDWIIRGKEVFYNKNFMKDIIEKLIKDKQEWVLIEAIAALSKNEEIEFACKTYMEEQRYDPVLQDMWDYLRLVWYDAENTMEKRGWLKIQFQKCFPDYLEELQKKRLYFEEDATKRV